MNIHIKEDLEDLPQDKWVPEASPANNHMFKVNKYGELLYKEQGILFQKLVAQFVFIIKQARTGIQPTI